MRIRNKITGTYPIVVHAPDESPIWKEVVDSVFRETPEIMDAGVEIITWNNLHKGIFEKSLEHFGLPYVVYGRDTLIWNNFEKFNFNLDAAQKTTSKYLMGVDSHDAAVVSSPAKLVEIFESLDCDILFNCESYFYPNYPLPYFQDAKEFQSSLTTSKYKFLNSGAWIGRTDFCKEFFEYCKSIRLWERFDCTDIPKTYNCDQSAVHDAFSNFYPRVKLDYNCDIFFNIARIDRSEIKI